MTKKYLEHAKKSIEYFIEKDYTQYSDHWISYAMNEMANYTDDEEYYKFGLNNVSANLNEIENKTITSHIDFEMLLQCFELYNKGKKKFNDSEMIISFPYERLIETIKKRANYQLNSYMYPEVAMFFNKPEKYLNSFFIRQSNFRIRIDDIQHSILGYKSYLNNYEEIHN